MEEKKHFISTKFYKWSDFELNDLFSIINVPLNKIEKSIGFYMVYDSLDDACDSDEDIENLIEIKIETIDNIEKHYI